jgi:hypothetical protein
VSSDGSPAGGSQGTPPWPTEYVDLFNTADMRREAASTGDTAKMGQLYRCPLSEVRSALADNPGCPAQILDLLGSQGQPTAIRLKIASRPDAPKGTLVRLSQDPDLTVNQMAVATLGGQRRTGSI